MRLDYGGCLVRPSLPRLCLPVSGELIDRFRYTSIPPLLLPADGEYIIAAANFGQNAE
jgi:hypothetical protein